MKVCNSLYHRHMAQIVEIDGLFAAIRLSDRRLCVRRGAVSSRHIGRNCSHCTTSLKIRTLRVPVPGGAAIAFDAPCHPPSPMVRASLHRPPFFHSVPSPRLVRGTGRRVPPGGRRLSGGMRLSFPPWNLPATRCLPPVCVSSGLRVCGTRWRAARSGGFGVVSGGLCPVVRACVARTHVPGLFRDVSGQRLGLGLRSGRRT